MRTDGWFARNRLLSGRQQDAALCRGGDIVDQRPHSFSQVTNACAWNKKSRAPRCTAKCRKHVTEGDCLLLGVPRKRRALGSFAVLPVQDILGSDQLDQLDQLSSLVHELAVGSLLLLAALFAAVKSEQHSKCAAAADFLPPTASARVLRGCLLSSRFRA